MPNLKRVKAQPPRLRGASIAFVGEAPGVDEALTGKPFVGAAGRLFGLTREDRYESYNYAMSILGQAGIERETALVTNVFEERPPENNVQHFFMKRGDFKKAKLESPYPVNGTRGYLRPEFDAEITRLKSELEAENPNIIVALGATALWALTGFHKITEHRGTITANSLLPLNKVLPTYHPAAVLRQYNWFPIVVADLVKAVRESKYPEVRRPNRLVRVAETADEVEKYCGLFKAAPLLGCDVETKYHQISTIGFAPNPQDSFVIPIITETGSFWSWNDEQRVWKAVKKLMEYSPVAKMFQNAAFDVLMFNHHGVQVRGVIEDTMIMHHALQPELQKGLDMLGSLYTDELAWKNLVKFKAEKRDA
jgi:DNA polymerase